MQRSFFSPTRFPEWRYKLYILNPLFMLVFGDYFFFVFVLAVINDVNVYIFIFIIPFRPSFSKTNIQNTRPLVFSQVSETYSKITFAHAVL